MGIFDGFAAVLGAKAPTSRDLETRLAEARRLLEEQQVSLQRLKGERRQALAGSDGDRERLRRAIDEAESNVVDAGEFIAALEEKLAEARRREADAAWRANHKAALAARDAVAKRLKAELPELGRRYADLVRAVAESDLKIIKVNGDRPEGAEPIVGAEALVRDIPAQPRKVLGQSDVERWTYEETGHLVPPEYTENIQGGGGRGLLTSGRLGTPKKVVRRRFREVRFLAESRRTPGPRIADYAMPGLKAGEGSFWSPNRASDSPEAVIRRLDALAASRAEPADPREVETEYLPLDAAEPVDA